MICKKIVDYLSHPKKIAKYVEFKILHSSYGKRMDDEKYIKKLFKLKMGYEPDLDNPKTYNEKLQWLKLNDRNPEYTAMVDKYLSKQYVAERIGEEYVVPLLGVWDSFDEIDFDKLPERFVLKTTHDCGGVVICKDKSTFDRDKAKAFLNKHLAYEYFYHCREWPYKDVKPRILAEEYLEGMDEFVEYKMFCFSGKVKMVLVCKGQAHGAGRTYDYCDTDLNRFPFTSLNPNSEGELPVPEQMPELIALAEKLSEGIPQLRVDTYLADGKIYLGELTFFHNGGMAKFDPPEWDEKLGEWIELSTCKKD